MTKLSQHMIGVRLLILNLFVSYANWQQHINIQRQKSLKTR